MQKLLSFKIKDEFKLNMKEINKRAKATAQEESKGHDWNIINVKVVRTSDPKEALQNYDVEVFGEGTPVDNDHSQVFPEEQTPTPVSPISQWQALDSMPKNIPFLLYFEIPFDNSNIHVAMIKDLPAGNTSTMVSGKWLYNLENNKPKFWTHLPSNPQ